MKWELRITFGQVLLLWAALAVAMLVVFLFGFHRGRDDGLAIAFEEYSEQTVRLPVVQPVAPPAGQTAAVSQKAQASVGVSSPEQALASAGPAARDKNGKEVQFDFSSNKAGVVAAEQGKREPTANEVAALVDKKAAEKAASAGIASKPALELFSGEAAAGAEKQRQIAKLAAGTEAPRDRQVEGPAKMTAPVTAGAASASAVPAQEPQPSTNVVSGWYIQASATQVPAEASGSIRKLQRAGYQATIEKAQIRDRTYLRVLAGPYPDRESASRAKDKLSKAGVVSGVPFIKYVK